MAKDVDHAEGAFQMGDVDWVKRSEDPTPISIHIVLGHR